jgi:hypothetical protein
MRRKMLGMRQTKLGDQLGVTFQQMEKYEKGMNRIGLSRCSISRTSTMRRRSPGFIRMNALVSARPSVDARKSAT